MQTMVQPVQKYFAFRILVLIVSINLSGLNSNIAVAQEEVQTVVSGVVVDAQANPVAGATVALCRHSEDIARGKSATADEGGFFSISLVVTPTILESMHLECKSADGSAIGYLSLRPSETQHDLRSIALRLDAVKKAKVLVIDVDEKPVVEATTIARLGDTFGRVVSATTDASGIAELTYTDSEPIGLAFAWKDRVGFDYHLYQPAQQGLGAAFSDQKPERFKLDGANSVKLRLVDDQKRPLKGIKVYPFTLSKATRTNLRSSDLNLSFFSRFVQHQTDANGEVSFDWLPAWHKGWLTFMSSGGNEVVHAPMAVDLETVKGFKEIQLDKTVAIRGKVVGVDGMPVKGITISASGAGAMATSKTSTDQTDEQGNYEVLVAPNQICMVIVKDRQWGSAPQQGFAVYPNTPVEGKDFKLRKATRIFGKVRGGFWHADVRNHRVVVQQVGKSLNELTDIHLPDPEPPRKLNRRSKPTDSFETWTDARGNFELFVGDGNFVRLTDGQGKEFSISGEESYEMDFTANARTMSRVSNDPTATLVGQIIDGVSEQPLRDCRVTIVPRASSPGAEDRRPSWVAATDAEGKFRAERMRVGSFVHAISSDKKLAGIMEIKSDKDAIVMKLWPVGSATGRLLSADDSEPIAKQQLGCFYIVPLQGKDQLAGLNSPMGTLSFVVDCQTDADGRFKFEHLVPNVEYRVYQGPSINVRAPLSTVKVDAGEKIDLGDIKVP